MKLLQVSAIVLTVALDLAAQSAAPWQVAGSIALPGVRGRIDHLSVDLKSQRLFVAALGNNTVEILGLKSANRIGTVSGLNEPQGVLYVPAVNRLYVANGGDGSLRIFDGSSFKPIKSIAFGDDADNLRYDAARQRIYVGYGDGAIGEIDAEGNKVGNIKLDAHPESFQIEPGGNRMFVNLPGSRKVAVIDLSKQSVIASWKTDGATENFPMALDDDDHRLFVVCRSPSRLLVLDTGSGNVVASLPSVGDSDDVFYDKTRRRVYASGGGGDVWVYQQIDADHYREMARIPTAEGARTSLFSPELAKMFVAVRQNGQKSAEIRVYDVK